VLLSTGAKMSFDTILASKYFFYAHKTPQSCQASLQLLRTDSQNAVQLTFFVVRLVMGQLWIFPDGKEEAVLARRH
jgi:hypothetical protein